MTQNRTALLWASFLTLIAAGMGFAVRGGLLKPWSQEFGFTMTELGQITGGGLIGFGIVILLCGAIIDKVGYKVLLMVALLCHIISAVMLFAAKPVYLSSGQDATYQLLFWSSFIFAVGNGICEGVINPLVAALYPEQKTHYLNILHAGWPGGLVIGGLLCLLIGQFPWEILLATYLIPAAVYGFITMTNKFPQTEVQSGGISYGGMLTNCLVPFFFVILIAHAMVGYVELGTDSWINKITGAILESPAKGAMLFIYTSTLMFVLRFFAGPIVHRISSLGLLFISAIIGAVGLYMLGSVSGVVMMVVAATIYGIGKTFLWPTMLGVVGEQFPKSSTLAMAILGAVGMLSAGFLGGPGIGYKQDYYASADLEEKAPETFDRYKAGNKNQFLIFPEITGLDGRKVGVISDNAETLKSDLEIAGDRISEEKFQSLRELNTWWQENKEHAPKDKPPVSNAGLFGSRMALKLTALVPGVMAVIYLLLILGFKMKGGYKIVEDSGATHEPKDDEVAGHGRTGAEGDDATEHTSP